MTLTGINQTPGTLLTGTLKSTEAPAAKAENEQTPMTADGFSKSEVSTEKKVNWKAIGKLALGTVAIGALGVVAGLTTGPLAAAAGAVAGLAGGVGVGLLAGGFIGDKIGHGDSSKVAGAAIWGTIAGAAAGLGGGLYLGLTAACPAAAITLGVLGAVGGFGRSLFSMEDK